MKQSFIKREEGILMDQILLCSNHIPLVTSINNSFIQKYMLNANGSYVKVYLYLSMCIQSGKENLSISSLADMMENTEKDIIRALLYWEKKGLMLLQRDDTQNVITGIDIINPDTILTNTNVTKNSTNTLNTSLDKNKILPEQTVGMVQNIDTANEKHKVTTKPYNGNANTKSQINIRPNDSTSNTERNVSKTQDDTATNTICKADNDIKVTSEQTTRLAQDETFSWTCLIVESYLERTLKPAEIQLLTYLYDNLKFSKELILHLYEYCCSLNKTNAKYVQAVALSWADHNITTPEEAQKLSTNYSTAHTAISKALALGRPLAGIECQYVERWQNHWHMDLAVILEACNRTMLTIQKADFKYLDGILNNWHKDNVHTLQDVKLCDEKYKKKKNDTAKPKIAKENSGTNKRNQFQSFQQRNTSQDEIDELEKILLTR